MARNMYEYSTSPRKLEPDYKRKRQKRKVFILKVSPEP